MRIAFTSDLHLGSPNCELVTTRRNSNGTFSSTFGKGYDKFIEHVGQDLDYLVLVGDVFDFSICSYEEAYECGRRFFKRIRADGVLRETEDPERGAIIFVPGNHDGDIWHVIQHQRSIIKRIGEGRPPQAYDHSVAGVMDLRTSSPTYGFTLHKTTVQKQGKKYGGMFLDYITGGHCPTPFYFAYPNLYVIIDEDNSILVTHGQYLEAFWAFGSEVVVPVAYDAMKNHAGSPYVSPDAVNMDIERMVEMNFPLSQLSCSGIGQAGVLTSVIRQVRDSVYEGTLTSLERYYDRSVAYFSEPPKGWFLKSWLGRLTFTILKWKIFNWVEDIDQARYNEEFIEKKEVQRRFKRYYEASLHEIQQVAGWLKEQDPKNGGCNIPEPLRIIFGHTHLPIPWDKKPPIAPTFNRKLSLHNMGGRIREGRKWHGAEIFLYDCTDGFRSVSVR